MKKIVNSSKDLSYFTVTLKAFLKENHPQLYRDETFIRIRSDNAIETFERAIRDGASNFQAMELANTVLYEDLRFSKFDALFEVISEYFPEIKAQDRTNFCLKILPFAEQVFKKYSISDDFETTPAYHTLLTELTGFIETNIEQYGL